MKKVPSRSVPLATWLCTAVLLLVGSLGLQQLAWWQYDRLLTDRALYDLSLRVAGETPFAWSLREAGELSGAIHGLGDYRLGADGLVFTAANADPHFSLQLGGRLIDQRYQHLTLSLTSSEEARLQLFHRQPGEADFIFGSEWIPLQAGPQSLALNLAALRWHAIPLTAAAVERPRPVARWGGESGVISDLRLDPVDRAGVRVQLQGLVLQSGLAWPRLDAQTLQVLHARAEPVPAGAIVVLERSDADARDWLARQRHAPLLLADGSRPRTPELGRLFRDRVLAIAPQAVWFPAPPDARLLERIHAVLAGAPQTDARWRWSERQRPAAVIAALALLVYLLTLFGPLRDSAQARWLVVLLVPVMAACAWINADALTAAPGLASLAALLAGLLAWLHSQPGSLRQRLGLVRAPAAAWRGALWLSLPALLVLLAVQWLPEAGPLAGKQLGSRSLWLYPAWVLVQQLFFAVWLTSALAWAVNLPQCRQALLPVATLAGLCFALLHFPNYGAMAMVYLIGTGWAVLWLRHRSLWPLLVSHAVLGLLFALGMPALLRMDGDIGRAYFSWLW